MANEALTSAVKQIIGLARTGQSEASYEGYRDLFAAPAFTTFRPEDQRQALRLMVRGTDALKGQTPATIEAHRAALGPLTELVSTYGEPGDYEMLGICHLFLGNAEAASSIYREGLTIERERNAGSDLCGALMKRVSLI